MAEIYLDQEQDCWVKAQEDRWVKDRWAEDQDDEFTQDAVNRLLIRLSMQNYHKPERAKAVPGQCVATFRYRLTVDGRLMRLEHTTLACHLLEGHDDKHHHNTDDRVTIAWGVA